MKFEYKQLQLSCVSIVSELNKLGEEGWELVSAVSLGTIGMYYDAARGPEILWRCIMKRYKPD